MLACLVLFGSLGGLTACTPPEAHVRVDVRIAAQGQCEVEGTRLACDQAGPAMVARHPGQAIAAVILSGPDADPAGKQAVLTGLGRAHISHIQFGDPAAMSFEPAPRGIVR
jgi:hypothetical protein